MNTLPDKNTMLLVRHVLSEEKLTRDNDIELFRQFWLREKPSLSIYINPICDSLQLGEITFPDSITRARRKAQELNRNLRGYNWDLRHRIAEDPRQLLLNLGI